MADFKDLPQKEMILPVGTAIYPHLHAKDTRFDEPEDAEYKTKYNLPADKAQTVLDTAKELIREAHKKGLASNDPVSPGEQEDDGSRTFNLHTKHRPALFDAGQNRLEPGLKVGGGTKMRAHVTLKVYEGFGKTGVTMYLNGVQIIDLKTFGSNEDRDAESFGFDATEGFTGEDLGEMNGDPFGADEGDLDEGDEPEFPADF